MPAYPLDVIETHGPADESEATACFVPLPEVAATLGVEATTVRRMVWSKKVEARLRENGRGYEVNVATLPPGYRVKFAARIAPPASAQTGPSLLEKPENASRFASARTSVRERAEFRYEAVLSLRRARAAKRPGQTYAEAERQWYRNFSRSHAGRKFSIRSVKAWDQMLQAASGSIDALVDGNDGSKQRGSRVPAKHRQMFKDEWLRSHRPNIGLIYRNVQHVAKAKGWGNTPSYDSFWRVATKYLPKLVRKLLRDCADKPRTVLPHVVRDPSSLPAYHTIQSDIRQLDVPVRCDKGCEVCTGKKPKGHFPFWTAFFDIRSRRLLGSELSIETPTSDLILGVFRRVCSENGLPCCVYLDNGANYRKAFGKQLWSEGKTEWDGPSEDQIRTRFAPVGIEVVYALPYNAQAKPIERMLLTFRQRFDENFEAYRGSLESKSELARELFYRPSELPTLSELAYLLQLEIDEYNATPHTGRGMERAA
jgi:hypothetical protein